LLHGRDKELDASVKEFVSTSGRSDVLACLLAPKVMTAALLLLLLLATLTWMSYSKSRDATQQAALTHERENLAWDQSLKTRNALDAPQRNEESAVPA